MSILLEKTRRELLDTSRHADIVKSYGTTRYGRKNKQHIYNTLNNFNKIDMNSLFKGNTLSLTLPIHGETDNYEVDVLFEGVCDDIKREIKNNKNKLEYKCVYRALIKAINKQNIFISCSCPDWKYRFAYWATKDDYNGGRPEVRVADITNPGNTKGAGCKHTMNVLGNLDWALKLATVINNYIDYMRVNYEDKFASIIFPAIYDMPYDKAVQMDLFNTGDLGTKEDTEDVDNSIKSKEVNKNAPIEEPNNEEEDQQELELDFDEE